MINRKREICLNIHGIEVFMAELIEFYWNDLIWFVVNQYSWTLWKLLFYKT